MNNRVAVAISGGGRTLANLISKQPELSYQIAAVISSSAGCKGNQLAEQNRLPLLVESFRANQDPTMIAKLNSWLSDHHIDWIALAGFIRPFPILTAFQGRIINIHPALLPKYGGKGMYGINVHKAVLEAGETVSGATIHYVTERYDEGAVISQIETSIAGLTTAQQVADAVFQAECQLYPATLNVLVNQGSPRTIIKYQH